MQNFRLLAPLKVKIEKFEVSQSPILTSLIYHWILIADPALNKRVSGADPGFCEGGFERGFVDSLKGTFEQK